MVNDRALNATHETSKARKEREERERAVLLPPGLINDRNACYMNSVLQALIATRLLSDMLYFKPLPPHAKYASYSHYPVAPHRSPHLTNGHGVAGKYEKPWMEGMHLGDSFLRVMATAWYKQQQIFLEPIDPRGLLQEMARKHSQYIDDVQQDAHEFLVRLLDTIRMEEVDIIRKRQPVQISNSSVQQDHGRAASAPSSSSQTKPLDSNVTQSPRKSASLSYTPDHGLLTSQTRAPSIFVPQDEETLVSFVDMLFGGRLTSILVCQKCHHVSQRYEDFIDLSLPIRQEEAGRKRGKVKQFAKKLMAGMHVMRSSHSPRSEHGEVLHEIQPNVSQEHRERISNKWLNVVIWEGAENLPHNAAVESDTNETAGSFVGEEKEPGRLDKQTKFNSHEQPIEETQEKEKGGDSCAKFGERLTSLIALNAERKSTKGKEKEWRHEGLPLGSSKEMESMSQSASHSSRFDVAHPAPRQLGPPSSAQRWTPEIIAPQPQTAPPLSAQRFRTSPSPNSNQQRPTLSRGDTNFPQLVKPSAEEDAYLRRLLADTVSTGPFARFKPHVVPGSDTAQNLWSISIEDCLRMFTAVEKLEGENSVGCWRCWKILNDSYNQCPPGDSDLLPKNSGEQEEKTGIALEISQTPISPSSVFARDSRLEHLVATEALSPSTSSTSIDASDHVSVSTLPTTLDSCQRAATSAAVPGDQPTQPMQTPAIGGTPADWPVPLTSAMGPTSPQAAPKLHLSPRRHEQNEMGEPDEFEYSLTETSHGSSPCSHDTTSPESHTGSPSTITSLPKRVIMRPAYKRYLIASAPPILILHLKRFHRISKMNVMSFVNGFSKLDDYVRFPEYLDLGPFLAPVKEDLGSKDMGKHKAKGGEPFKYRLYAVVVHIGNVLGGHYVAYVALPPPSSSESAIDSYHPGDTPNADTKTHTRRQWAYVSDHNVRLTTLAEVLRAKAYICMYERL